MWLNGHFHDNCTKIKNLRETNIGPTDRKGMTKKTNEASPSQSKPTTETQPR